MAQIHHSGACLQRAALLACRLVAETQGAIPGQEPADRPALVKFVAGCDATVQRLQADFQPISARIGQVSEPYESVASCSTCRHGTSELDRLHWHTCSAAYLTAPVLTHRRCLLLGLPSTVWQQGQDMQV